MNTNTKVLIGAGIGGALGYFVGSVVVEILALKEEGRELDYYDFENRDLDQNETNQEKEMFERPTNMATNKTTKKDYSQIFKKNPELASLVQKYNEGQIEEAEETLEGEEIDASETFESSEDSDDLPIAIVSLEEYANATGFESVTLNYYDDDVVTDVHDIPISHPEEILGDEALVSFGELSNDPDVVYVRNLNKNAMYEVVRTNKNYGAHLQKSRRLAAKEQMRRDRIDRMGEEDENGEANHST